MILKVLAAGQSQLHSLRLSEGITLALRYVYKWKELENESWICHHLCNSIDKSFPTHWNATLALMAIDKTVHLQSILSIVSCSPAYCSHMLYITWIKKKKNVLCTHTHTHRACGDRCSNFPSSSPISCHKCENLIITAAHNHFYLI